MVYHPRHVFTVCGRELGNFFGGKNCFLIHFAEAITITDMQAAFSQALPRRETARERERERASESEKETARELQLPTQDQEPSVYIADQEPNIHRINQPASSSAEIQFIWCKFLRLPLY